MKPKTAKYSAGQNHIWTVIYLDRKNVPVCQKKPKKFQNFYGPSIIRSKNITVHNFYDYGNLVCAENFKENRFCCHAVNPEEWSDQETLWSVRKKEEAREKRGKNKLILGKGNAA